jgi:hypothetical protein
MRTSFILLLAGSGLLITGCSNGFVDLSGSVNGKKVNGNAFWGGPHIVFTNDDLGCQELDWVATTYGTSDRVSLQTSESFATLQISFRSSDIVDGESGITATGPPANAWFLESDGGDAEVLSAKSGMVDVEIDGDWLVGNLEVDFGEAGKISGDFEIQNCVNLKSVEGR